MNKGAINFIKNRKKVTSITYSRINQIISYVIDCYTLLIKSKTIYSRTYVSTNTTLTLEDYLKMELVDKYLIPYKKQIAKKCFELESINFHYELQKRYVDVTDGKEKPDKIDIYINRLGLQDSWKEEDEHLYFAIECKRISNHSDCAAYLIDTQKFANREYQRLRLPFEGQLAFIESAKITPSSISREINKRLLEHSSTITTTKNLEFKNLENSANSCYISEHRRNYKNNEIFTVFHLLFDYSNILEC